MLPPELRERIRAEFLSGTLRVGSVKDGGSVGLSVITDVMKHQTPHKDMLEVHTTLGTVTCTEDHSLFGWRTDGLVCPVLTNQLLPGMGIVGVEDGQAKEVLITSIQIAPREEYTFDLSVPETENFILSNGVLAHNSYSIGGVSLDLEKSSKYESLKQNAETQFDKAGEAKARTVKYIRGLQQPRFGLGVRSSFGPYVGAGILSPRSFI